MIVVNTQTFDSVEIYGVRYPVSETLLTSAVFFRVVDVYGRQQFYIDPESYYDTAHRRPDENGNYAEWAERRQAFLQSHRGWYDRIDRIKNDVAGWLEGSNIEKRGYRIGQCPYIL